MSDKQSLTRTHHPDTIFNYGWRDLVQDYKDAGLRLGATVYLEYVSVNPTCPSPGSLMFLDVEGRGGQITPLLARPTKLPPAQFQAELRAHKRYANFRGIRCRPNGPNFRSETWDDQPDRLYGPNVWENFATLEKEGFVFDLWYRMKKTSMRSVLVAVALIARSFPKLKIVLNHLGTPVDIANDDMVYATWKECIDAYARIPNVYAKLSGLMLELGFPYTNVAGAPGPTARTLSDGRFGDMIRFTISKFGAESRFDYTKQQTFPRHDHTYLLIILMGSLVLARGESKQIPRAKISNLNFRVPVSREYLLGLGLVSVDRKSLEYILGKGESAVIVVGGAEEASKARPFTNDLVLNRRFGFVKLALRFGAWLVPMYSFGEGDIWDIKESEKGDEFSHWLKKYFGVTFPLITGRGVFTYNYGFLPYRRPINTVVGEPLEMPHIPEPTEEQVHEHHERYVSALKKVWDANKDLYAKNRRKSLRLVE
ncbi:diacylglycerol O-acyltransferase 1 [Gonapodya sp. JEL0774]|nr:diacylglycerol O-acyltransferase 1 [Gonapodya sp. JEL0774]